MTPEDLFTAGIMIHCRDDGAITARYESQTEAGKCEFPSLYERTIRIPMSSMAIDTQRPAEQGDMFRVCLFPQ